MEILNQFGVNPMLLAAQVVNFLLLLFILKKFAYGPILKVLDQRKKTIADSLKNAEEIQKQLALTEEAKEKILGEAFKDAQKIKDDVKKEMDVFKEEMRVQTELQGQQIIKKSEENAKAEDEKMREKLMTSFAEIVGVAMEKVSGKSFSKKDKQDIIAREIKNLS